MLECHDGHDVNELYSKLDFRCDCGNSKLPNQCSLLEDKDYANEGNRYNQNYFGLYCYCKQPHDQEAIDAQKVSDKSNDCSVLYDAMLPV